jgi:hypothetical protein
MPIRAKSLSVGLPFGLGSIEFEANEVEQRAAWSLYVELTTRVAIQPFDPDTGSLRSVLTSLYSLFSLTREILRDAGPDVAHGPNSFGPIAIRVLVEGLAPFTTRWHQPLLDYQQKCLPDVSVLAHERVWEHFSTMQNELAELQQQMRIYAEVLAKIAGAAV